MKARQVFLSQFSISVLVSIWALVLYQYINGTAMASTATKEIEASASGGKITKRKKAHSPSPVLPVKHGRHKKLKRSRSSTSTTNGSTTKKKTSILSGVTIAVSTLQNDGGDNDNSKNSTPTKMTKQDTHSSHEQQQHSYKAVTDLCRTAGATVSSQVHKKVKCVLCTPAAVAQATQRVRKARKKSIPLVDVAWLFACLKQSKQLEFDAYVLDYPEQLPPTKSTGSTNNDGEIHVECVDARDIPEDAGWTEAVNVGCCCVCHENGDTDCPWCTSCNV